MKLESKEFISKDIISPIEEDSAFHNNDYPFAMSADKREENLSLGADFGKIYGSGDYERHLKLQSDEEEKEASITEPEEGRDLGDLETKE